MTHQDKIAELEDRIDTLLNEEYEDKETSEDIIQEIRSYIRENSLTDQELNQFNLLIFSLIETF